MLVNILELLIALLVPGGLIILWLIHYFKDKKNG